MHSWLIVHATGTVQAVYGPALRDMADEKAKHVPLASVSMHTGPRPRIGDKFPPASPELKLDLTPTKSNIIRD